MILRWNPLSYSFPQEEAGLFHSGEFPGRGELIEL